MPEPTDRTNSTAPPTNTDGVILESAGITKSYGRGAGRNHVLHGVDMAVRHGEFVAVMGKSGCGPVLSYRIASEEPHDFSAVA